jgi:sugar O-acyltransferase (sialic acid O-acetyltransferase NeuD family)
MKTKLFIFPFNGNGLEALDCISNEFELIGFIDDTPEKQGLSVFGVMVFNRSIIAQYPEAKVLAVPGSPTSFKIRGKIITDLGLSEDRFATVIHPKSSVSPFAKIGHNVLIMAGVVITSNAVIDNHVCILPNTVIHHDVTIGAYTLIGSNVSIAGITIIENNCYIGSGSKIMNGIRIEKNSLVGLGTTVLKSLPENSKVVGNPARFIK